MLKVAAARKSRNSSPSSVPKKSLIKSAVKKAGTSEGELTILKKKTSEILGKVNFVLCTCTL